jgi:hypothetical protein
MERLDLLMLGANPRDTARLDLDVEVRRIREKLRAATHRDRVSVEYVGALRPTDLVEIIADTTANALHFCGHATAEGVLLTTDAGQQTLVHTRTVVDLLRVKRQAGGVVRLCVLNACETEETARAVVRHVDCAVGMSDAVPDRAALDFSTALYRHLAEGRSVHHAFELARITLEAASVPGAHIPRLLERAPGVARGLMLGRPLTDPGPAPHRLDGPALDAIARAALALGLQAPALRDTLLSGVPNPPATASEPAEQLRADLTALNDSDAQPRPLRQWLLNAAQLYPTIQESDALLRFAETLA